MVPHILLLLLLLLLLFNEDHVCFEDRWMVASLCDE
jgi:inner membrane protein involved in colicin E2 resistance